MLLGGLAASAVEGIGAGHAGEEREVPLRIVSRHQPRCTWAQRFPPRPIAATVLAMKTRFRLPLRALAASMRTGIISGSGRISVAPGPPVAKSHRIREEFCPFKPLNGTWRRKTWTPALTVPQQTVVARGQDMDADGVPTVPLSH